ncbi:phospholipase D family protein [Shimia abyssi]|uniref:Phospholipase D n=1 Tax=Shimia abyssi TaxID=1662395 RepID=A0A2P8FCD2_9RHOB|nr:phospholipase D family protein [Shimia abyssi]PSL19389.1 putative cardiolipin synthase [Shimia abyssi]
MRFVRWTIFLVLLGTAAIFSARLIYPLPEQNFATEGRALPPDWDGPLGQTIKPALETHSGLDGVHPLGNGRLAFAARAILARQAVSSIDAQYYIWQDDVTGLMLLEELRAAAERGVRVRLLVDDNGIPGMDDVIAELDAMAAAEVRIFNPFTLRSPKLLSYAFDFPRLNRRMHNKSMTVDGVATIVGGRNIGDIYFDYGAGTHYLDVDTIAIGPIVTEVSGSFDSYWNSGSAYDAALILPAATSETIKQRADAARNSALGAGYQKAIEQNEIVEQIAARNMTFEWSDVQLLVDDPALGLGQADDADLMGTQLAALATQAEVSLDIVSAYFIPGQGGRDILEGLARSGVKTRVLTNSMDATDVMPVHAAYARYRPGLLESGVELLELRALREEHKTRSLPEVLAGSASGLHAKVFGIDGKRVLIGSYNLDPRSARLNTEMGLLIESPTLAQSLAAQLDKPGFAYRVTINNGSMIWTEYQPDGTTIQFDQDPHTSLLQRTLAAIVRLLPVEWML